MNRTLKTAVASLIFNLAYGIYHIVTGVITHSWWMLIVGVYYCVLSFLRSILVGVRRNQHVLFRFTGWMLIVLSILLIGTVILSVVGDVGHRFHMIVMIAFAAYAFTKMTLATVKLIKSRHSTSPQIIALRNVSFAHAFVSVFSWHHLRQRHFQRHGLAEAVIAEGHIGIAGFKWDIKLLIGRPPTAGAAPPVINFYAPLIHHLHM